MVASTNRLAALEPNQTRREVSDTYPKTSAELFPQTRLVLLHTDTVDVIAEVYLTLEDDDTTVEAEVISLRRKCRADFKYGLCFSSEQQREAERKALELV